MSLTVKTTFEMDYSRSLKFQLLPAESPVTNEQSSQTNVPGVDEVLKGVLKPQSPNLPSK